MGEQLRHTALILTAIAALIITATAIVAAQWLIITAALITAHYLTT